MGSTRMVAITGVLAIIQLALVLTGLGSVPLPTGLNVTVLAIPSVLAGVLAGPIAGAVVGGVFGVTSLALATSPLFQNPVIAIVPRVLIGPIAASYIAASDPPRGPRAWPRWRSRRGREQGPRPCSGDRPPGPLDAPYLAPAAAWDVARTNLPSEVVLAALVAVVVGVAVRSAASRH